jgi:hypothetical protein
MQTSEVLNKAADLIEERGWSPRGNNGAWHPKPGSTTPLCVEGALRLAAGRRDQDALDALSGYLNDRYPECFNPFSGRVLPFSWNDRTGRTSSEVIEVLRACAVIEASRERESAEVAS